MNVENEYKIKATEFKEIPEGKHTGVIKTVKLSEHKEGTNYDYLDFICTLDDKGFEDVTLRFGVPANISEISRLGKLLKDTGFTFKAGMDYGLQLIINHFEGKKIQYKTINVKGKHQKDLEFAEILFDTIEFID